MQKADFFPVLCSRSRARTPASRCRASCTWWASPRRCSTSRTACTASASRGASRVSGARRASPRPCSGLAGIRCSCWPPTRHLLRHRLAAGVLDQQRQRPPPVTCRDVGGDKPPRPRPATRRSLHCPRRRAMARTRPARVRRVIVVGGGLAGLMTTIKLCEANVPVLLVSLVPVKRSHSVCAQGGINACVEHQGRRRQPAHPSGRDRLRRRLPRQPAARQGHGRRRARHHRPARPHGRRLQPHARGPARLPPLRRLALPPHRPSPAPPPASSCCTRSTSRCAASRPPTSSTTRASACRARRWCTSSSCWDFLGLVRDDNGVVRRHRRAGSPHDAHQGLSRRRRVPGHAAARGWSSAARRTA